MSTAAATGPKTAPKPLNGVDTPTLLATINAVGGQPSLAKFQFRANNQWLAGTHSRSVISNFFGAGGEHAHKSAYSAASDHPAVLCGADAAPTPVEWLLHALASCVTAGIANIAAARGVKLTRVETSVTGDIDLRGILGLSKDVRNGYEGITLKVDIEGDAPREHLEKIVAQSKARSAVFDVLTNGVPVQISIG